MRYLGVAEVVALHALIMERTGERQTPLRDPGGLEGAVMRPRMHADLGGADLVRQCAVLAVGISQAQAFLDGNKRAAYAAADVFLRANRAMYAGDPLEMARRLEAVAERGDGLEAATARFEEWLRANVSERSP